MADENTEKKIVELKKGEIVVSEATLAKISEQTAKSEKDTEDMRARMAGLEQMVRDGAEGADKPKHRKEFTPAFRTVTLKKMAMNGEYENEGYVIGWTNRGAYHKIDRSGVSAVAVDYIDVLFLGHERNKEGKLQAESVPLLSLLSCPEVTCKVLEVRDHEGKPYKIRYQPMIDPDIGLDRDGERREYTGEKIRVKTFDPKHGLQETDDTIEGWVAFTDLTFLIQIPGIEEPIEIDSKFCNI